MIDPSIISTRLIDRLVLSHDASLYRLVPKAVVRPRNIADVQSLLEHCRQNNDYVTFRAAGTSLSGQAVTDGILADISRGWDAFEIIDNGNKVKVGPGITGGRVNGLLRRHGRKLGPDPASMAAAMIGGIVANNASGMCCGTEHNTYHTMDSITCALANGVVINTADADSDSQLQRAAPDVYDALIDLRNEVRSNAELTELIRRKYLIKNTMGYSLNAFLDEDLPSRILGRLMVGSEGTLGFIASVIYNTIPDASKKWTTILVYDTLEAACAGVPFWTQAGAAAVELMDDASLHSFALLPHTPNHLRFTQPGIAALLVEFHDQLPPQHVAWETDPRKQAVLWRLRKGLMPTIGAKRPTGTTMINEDVAVGPEKLAQLVVDVKASFARHGYDDAIIFGHAKDGNIHFVINQRFDSDAELQRYAAFMEDIAYIVADKHQGSLKAEHGTGRNMAPFVEREWGIAATNIMRRLKQILDPLGILNPGVVLNADALVHLKNIKPVPTIDKELDACIECGFCEHVCPTRNTTLTPRQRIVLRRELSTTNDSILKRELERAERTESINSCAVDSMCSSVCPVGIDTGQFVKRKRNDDIGFVKKSIGMIVERGYGFASPLIGATLKKLLRMNPTVSRMNEAKQHSDVLTNQHVNKLTHCLLVQGCPSRWLTDTDSIINEIALRASIDIIRLDNERSICCGQPFESQGIKSSAEHMLSNSLSRIKSTIGDSNTVAFTDTSTCGSAFIDEAKAQGINMQTPIAWLRETVLPRLQITNKFQRLAVHPGCGVHKTHEIDALMDVCSAIAHEVIIPSSAFCCGMAGAHGIQHSNIPPSVLHQEKADLESFGKVDGFVSLNPICEKALTKHVGIECSSLFDAILEATGEN